MVMPAWMTPWRYRSIPDWAMPILIRWPILQVILYRFRCPYPTIEDRSARACINSGNCGCDNSR